MTINRQLAIVIGLATIWPFLYFILFLALFLGSFALRLGLDGGAPILPVILILPLHLLTILIVFGLLVFYIIHVFKTDRIPNDMKAFWAVVLFMANLLAMPVYWYMYIWREDGTAGTPPPASPRLPPGGRPASGPGDDPKPDAP